jgi:hypothetical protein
MPKLQMLWDCQQTLLQLAVVARVARVTGEK